MLLWLAVILLVIGIVLGCIFDDFWEPFIAIAAFSFVAVLIMIPIAVSANTAIDAKIAKYNARYESLVYQYENDIYDNDNDLGKRDLMEDIERWNTDLAYKKEIQDNFWVGIFYPNIYDAFDLIELN